MNTALWVSLRAQCGQDDGIRCRKGEGETGRSGVGMGERFEMIATYPVLFSPTFLSPFSVPASLPSHSFPIVTRG